MADTFKNNKIADRGGSSGLRNRVTGQGETVRKSIGNS